MKTAIAFPALLLAACAGSPTQPDVEVRTVTKEVRVPVATPCFEDKDRPPAPVYTFTSQDQIDRATPKQLAEGLRADRLADEVYMAQIEALFVQCSRAQGKEPK